MPTLDYRCDHCGCSFKQVVLRGEEDQPVICRECGRSGVKATRASESLFDGIAHFSAMASDTN